MEKDLSSTPAWELDKFVEDHIIADTRFLNKVKADIDYICTFLKEKHLKGVTRSVKLNELMNYKSLMKEIHFKDVKISKVLMSGCFDSESDLKDTTEVNITIFLKGLQIFEEVFWRWEEFLEEIKKELCKLPGEEKFQLHYEVQNPEECYPSFLSFKLSSSELQQEVECRVWLARDVLPDVLPDVLHKLRNNPVLGPEICNDTYSELIHECTTPESEGNYSLSFVELQNNFLEDRPPKLKKLICLVKYWHQLCMEKLGKPVPPRYALELLTVYAWEHGSGVADFSIAQGFRTVLKLITKYEYLIIYWTVYYDFQHGEVSDYLRRQLQKDRPIILDPADPTRNIAGCTIMGWYFLADLAEEWLDYPCFKNRDGSQVRSWKVLVTRNFFSRSYFSFPVSP
ncbi:2'-5'-oligoadenylate synthase 1A-like isoform X2 [Mastomys coucha]|uniref:2'-5'-oligoadenylate synthase 1A-like isoform X2 n=1 Tax=Mastomys coucha TaxID=35658 RepID=UPI0012625CF0|nr:2'-5'-oligoadenylate synthase 1A-like isoform X2 [Mastomys coucha]